MKVNSLLVSNMLMMAIKRQQMIMNILLRIKISYKFFIYNISRIVPWSIWTDSQHLLPKNHVYIPTLSTDKITGFVLNKVVTDKCQSRLKI